MNVRTRLDAGGNRHSGRHPQRAQHNATHHDADDARPPGRRSRPGRRRVSGQRAIRPSAARPGLPRRPVGGHRWVVLRHPVARHPVGPPPRPGGPLAGSPLAPGGPPPPGTPPPPGGAPPPGRTLPGDAPPPDASLPGGAQRGAPPLPSRDLDPWGRTLALFVYDREVAGPARRPIRVRGAARSAAGPAGHP